MFWFKKRNKKYVSCDLIEHGMDFFSEAVVLCCRIYSDNGWIKTIDDFHGELIDWKKFFKVKRKFRNQMKAGNIIPKCKGCVYLQEKEWDNEDYISFINFNNWTKCNEHCIYCNLNDQPKKEQYNVLPVIKDMIEKGYLRKGGHITIAGGEPCFAPEFNELLKTFVEQGLKPIRVLTNATIHSESLEKAISLGNANICVSVDSGYREMFIKVKKYDFYDIVWENIKKYASAQINSDQVKTKFIIIPTINDKKEEIDEWIRKSIEAGVKHLTLDFEVSFYDNNKNHMPQNAIDIFNYAVEKIKENNLDIEIINRAETYLQSLKS